MYTSVILLALAGLSSASVIGINPNALPVPLDTATVALAKNAQLVQQAAEGARNILGGGIPVALPADTHEVAAGKVAHAVAVARQKAVVSHGAHVISHGPVIAAATHGSLIGNGIIAAGPIAHGVIGHGVIAPGIIGNGVVGHGIVAPGVIGHNIITPGWW